MNYRKPVKRIGHIDHRAMSEAVFAASKLDRPLNTHITVHPGRMDAQPADPGLFFRRVVRNKIDLWLSRNKVPWLAIWVRENYEGDGREHLHILAHVPPRLRADLGRALERWWPGDSATHVEAALFPRAVFGYVSKQLDSKAWYATRSKSDGLPAIRYEKHCRHTGAPVAPVLGKRCGITKALQGATRKWQARSASARLEARSGGVEATPANDTGEPRAAARPKRRAA